MGKIQKGNKKLGCRDDFDATIIKSRFDFEKEHVRTEIPSLIFTLEDNDGVLSQVAYATGSAWKIVDDGRRIEHQVRKNVVRGTKLGFLQERVLQGLGLGLGMPERGKPTDAEVWTGLRFHWKMEQISWSIVLPNEKPVKVIHLMPTKYLGGYEFKTTILPKKN